MVFKTLISPVVRSGSLLMTLLMIGGCASSPQSAQNNPSNGPTDPHEPSAEVGPASTGVADSPEYRYAEFFDHWVHGQSSPDELKDAKVACRASKENPFCPALLSRDFAHRTSEKLKTPRSPEPKVITPVEIEFFGNKIKNWRSVRNGKVPNLLKGVSAFSIEDLRKLAHLAYKENRCPNNALVAAAAALEDFLPAQVTPDELAPYYEKAAKCFPKYSADRENFLTRAGLFHIYQGDFKSAEKLFSKITPSDAFSGRTLYWLYRSRRELGMTEKAQAAYDRLLNQHRFAFHSILAASLGGKDPSSQYLSPSPAGESAATHRSKTNARINHVLEGAEILHRYHFDESAAWLADWGSDRYPHMEPGVRVYLAELGDAELQVTTIPTLLLKRPKLIQRETMELCYPKAFFSSFEKQQSTMDPYLLLALARKESRFDPKAISPTNAQGLLQIQPETAHKLVGDQTTMPDLLNPDTNIALGAKYIAELVQRQNGNLLLALASYNAGEDPVRTWIRRYATKDPILFIDLIPYRETRSYVTTVLANYYWYMRSYGQPGQDPIQQLVGQIAKK